jgi:2-polyprenyl-6-hydroxyphenyl methylase/3-demethylubiquinone-9 3-methyltransferase
MSVGKVARKVLGPFAGSVAEFYRNLFIDLDDLARTVASLAPEAKRVAEIGAGFGDAANALLPYLPHAVFYGVDMAHPSPGSLYTRPNKAVFTQQSSSELLAEQGSTFDLVLIVDVVHHVSQEHRAGLLRDAMDLTAPGGLLVVKDWTRDRTPIHALTYFSDRYLSSDKGVHFETYEALRTLIAPGDGWTLACETRIPPWRNNLLLAYRKDA